MFPPSCHSHPRPSITGRRRRIRGLRQPLGDVATFQFSDAPAFFQEMLILHPVCRGPQVRFFVIAAERHLKVDPASEFLDLLRRDLHAVMAIRQQGQQPAAGRPRRVGRQHGSAPTAPQSSSPDRPRSCPPSSDCPPGSARSPEPRPDSSRSTAVSPHSPARRAGRSKAGLSAAEDERRVRSTCFRCHFLRFAVARLRTRRDTGTVTIQDRLDLAGEAEAARRAVKRRQVLRAPATARRGPDRRRARCSSTRGSRRRRRSRPAGSVDQLRIVCTTCPLSSSAWK